MDTALAIHRLQFAFTVTFHYLFPQLTMGLALLVVILKTRALSAGSEHYNRCARFWVKIFAPSRSQTRCMARFSVRMQAVIRSPFLTANSDQPPQ